MNLNSLFVILNKLSFIKRFIEEVKTNDKNSYIKILDKITPDLFSIFQVNLLQSSNE